MARRHHLVDTIDASHVGPYATTTSRPRSAWSGYGQAGGRLTGVLISSLQPTFSPESFLTPPAVSSNSMWVMDKAFETPITHAWALSSQRELWSKTLVEVAYVGRRASSLFGAYNVNQADGYYYM